MASLNNLLNPDSSYEPSIRQAVLSPTTTSPTISPTEKTSESSSTAVELRPPPPRAEVVIRAHEPHPDCPDTLACLPDTDGRPQHTLPVILRCTILGSPRKRLTIREIYAAMERKYPYYKTAGPAWKQSVRHHLSLNRLFERQPRPPSDPGFGSYWTVNLEAPPGTKRPRKRGGRSNKVEYSENGPGPVHPPPLPAYSTPPMSQIAPPHPHPQKSVSTIAKLRPVDSRSFSQTSTMRSRRLYDEDEDDMDWEDGDGPQFSDDDYSSSEDMPYQYDPRAHNRNSSSYSGSSHRTYSGSQGQSGRSVLHGAFSSYSNTDHPDSTIERLKMEMAGLRRQSQDAVNASLRLSDQLTASQEDAARAKAALKVAENMLEEEARRRLQAEQNAEEEARRRRTAEESLRQYEAQARAQRKPNAYARA
ncbi:hypothetical protein DICSQDRAFT_142725 [Dichomitus squalens LYAD-421 SS1]|uniref:uncharacterized protein n=1 Tax=Dichomitus squalens (strain LYAD-421) TaxID=732165 RepID=UPI0004412D7D|nr:uncharacterized protein DICSQDRAFT_142725 [Dichomitus squalens LYAD-421 SS1]EJF67152.1 hypothetical protein DICSQDRAFT_142725 [Dichomitus squalens LYAD-421 SS1]